MIFKIFLENQTLNANVDRKRFQKTFTLFEERNLLLYYKNSMVNWRLEYFNIKSPNLQHLKMHATH